MSKHQMVTQQLSIQDIDLIRKEDQEVYVKSQLVLGLVSELMKNNMIEVCTKTDAKSNTTICSISLVTIPQEDYYELHDEVSRHNFQIIKDGKVTPLINLL